MFNFHFLPYSQSSLIDFGVVFSIKTGSFQLHLHHCQALQNAVGWTIGGFDTRPVPEVHRRFSDEIYSESARKPRRCWENQHGTYLYISMISLGMMKFLILLWHDWFDFQHAKTATYQKNWEVLGGYLIG